MGDYAQRFGEYWIERWLRGCLVGMGGGSGVVQGMSLVGVRGGGGHSNEGSKIPRNRIESSRLTVTMIGTYIYCANMNVIYYIYITV